jgi:hypothetical protein
MLTIINKPMLIVGLVVKEKQQQLLVSSHSQVIARDFFTLRGKMPVITAPALIKNGYRNKTYW